MKRILYAAAAFAVLSLTSFAQPDFAAVGVGDKNSLVIPGLLTLPAPGPAWEWMIGDTIKKSGVTVRLFFCQQPETERQYQVLVYSLPQPIVGEKEKREFIAGLLDGAVRGAGHQGYEIEKQEITASSIPSPGFHRYEYILRKDDTSLLLSGYILVGRHTISLQHSSQDADNRRSFEEFVSGLQLAEGLRNVAASEAHAATPQTSTLSTTLSYRIGRITGYILIGILLIAIVVKVTKKKKRGDFEQEN